MDVFAAIALLVVLLGGIGVILLQPGLFSQMINAAARFLLPLVLLLLIWDIAIVCACYGLDALLANEYTAALRTIQNQLIVTSHLVAVIVVAAVALVGLIRIFYRLTRTAGLHPGI